MKKTAVPQRPLVVTETDLLEVLTQRARLTRLRKEVREAEAALDQREAAVITLLKAGAIVQGHRSAVVQPGTGPCRPKYQELWTKHMAEYHGLTESMSLEVARKSYPGKPTEELVIGETFPGILGRQQGRA